MPAMTTVEAYAIIGVKKSASEAEVKSAYKKLALRTHPDKNPNDPDASKNFLRVSEAYKRIVDPSSFHEEDDDSQNINEEDFTSMCNMMFAEMFSGPDGGMFDFFGDDDDDDDGMDDGEDELDMLRAMEIMMNGGEYDDEDDSDDEYGNAERTIDENLLNLISSMSVGNDFIGGGLSAMLSGGKKKSKISQHSCDKDEQRAESSDYPDYDSDDNTEEAVMGMSENAMMRMMMKNMMTGSSSAMGAASNCRSSRNKTSNTNKKGQDSKTDEKNFERVQRKTDEKRKGNTGTLNDMASMLQMMQAMEMAAGKSNSRSSLKKSKNDPKKSRHRIDDDSDDEEGDWETASEDDSDDRDEEEVGIEQPIKGTEGTRKRAIISQQYSPSKCAGMHTSAPITAEHIDNSSKSPRMASSGSLSSESKTSAAAVLACNENITAGDRVIVNSKYVHINCYFTNIQHTTSFSSQYYITFHLCKQLAAIIRSCYRAHTFLFPQMSRDCDVHRRSALLERNFLRSCCR